MSVLQLILNISFGKNQQIEFIVVFHDALSSVELSCSCLRVNNRVKPQKFDLSVKNILISLQ